METYKVIRFYKESGRRKIIMRGVSREIAHLHCRSPLTSKAGIWFDGFERENNKR